MSNIEKCIQACQKSLKKNEYNMRKVNGIMMSYSDVEVALMYAETIQKNGTYQGILRKPHCAVAELLGKYGLIEE